MQFEDIVMLEIPGELSDLEAQGDVSSSDNPERPRKEYPKLQAWLSKEADLVFDFEQKAYAASVNANDVFSNAQVKYVTLLYKNIADLALKGIDSIPLQETEELIGVVSASSRDMGGSKAALYKRAMVNGTFSKSSSELRAFVDLIKKVVTNDEAGAFEDLISIFDCLEANCFAPTERNRPELVAQWINNYDPKPENEFIDSVMYNNPKPYKHPQFWTLYLGTLLLRGMFAQAESSLRSSKFEELSDRCPDLHAIIEDFTTLVGTYTTMSLKGQFAEWKYTVCEFRDNFSSMKGAISDPVDVTIASNIHDLLCLISGLPKTTASFVSTWYEMYNALSLFQVRDDSDVFLDYYQLSVHEKGIDIDSPLEEIFRNILQGKYLKVVLSIHDLDPATAAYLSKLFELKGFFASYYTDLNRQLEPQPPTSIRCVSDYLLTRHSFECFEFHRLVPVAIGILLTPLVSMEEDQRRDTLRIFLPNYQFLTNDDLEWALAICTKMKLPEVVSSLLFKRGDESLSEGYLYEALNVLAACYDENQGTKDSALALSKIHHIVWDLLFQDLLLNSAPVPDELLMNIITDKVDPNFPVNTAIRQCLAPVAVLTEFFLSLGDSSLNQKNILRLLHLLKFKYLPPKFVPLLLCQFLPFLVNADFEFKHFIIMLDLIDSYELQQNQRLSSDDEAEQLYSYAASTVPQDIKYDWRVQLEMKGEQIPEKIDDLIRGLRKKIMEKIGKVYIGA